MQDIIDVRRLHKPLMDAGLVPPNCRVWSMSIGVKGALSITYEIFLTAEQLVTLGRIFQIVGNLAPVDGYGKDDDGGNPDT
jgi:hypothetical protein